MGASLLLILVNPASIHPFPPRPPHTTRTASHPASPRPKHSIVDNFTVGLAWDVTNGVNIDLDASAIMLGPKLDLRDLVFFGKLRSSDGSIRHGGERPQPLQ